MENRREQIFREIIEEQGGNHYDIVALTNSVLYLRMPEYNRATVGEGSKTKLDEFFKQVEDLGDYFDKQSLNVYHQDNDTKTKDTFNWFHFTWKGKEYEIVNCIGYNYRQVIVLSLENITEITKVISEIFDRVFTKIEIYEDQCFYESSSMVDHVSSFHWGDIYLPDDQIKDIRNAVETFFRSEDVYKSLNVTWKRGILFSSAPGMGKTQLCKIIINELNLPALYIKSLKGYDSTESALYDIFKKARTIAPCVVIMEDLDSVINEENRTVFLNELDGFTSNDGVLLIASTNHPEYIDPAIMKRPSRFDRIFKIEAPSKALRYKYIKDFIEKTPYIDTVKIIFDYEEFLEKMSQWTEGLTFAYVKEVFIGVSLEYANNNQSDIDDDYLDKIQNHIRRLKVDMKAIQGNKEVGKNSMGFSNV